MAIRTVGAALVIVSIAWGIGCEEMYVGSGDEPAGDTRAEGTWAGGFSTATQTVGSVSVQIDAQGKVTGGMGWISGFDSSNVKGGSLRTDGLLQVDFQNGGSFRSPNATLSGDGTTLSGSGTFRAPDGTTQNVSFSLSRQTGR